MAGSKIPHAESLPTLRRGLRNNRLSIAINTLTTTLLGGFTGAYGVMGIEKGSTRDYLMCVGFAGAAICSNLVVTYTTSSAVIKAEQIGEIQQELRATAGSE